MPASSFDFDVITGPSTPRPPREERREPARQPQGSPTPAPATAAASALALAPEPSPAR